MPLLKVISKRDSLNIPLGVKLVPIDRASVLGNPFDMGRDEGLRDSVCDAHEAWLAMLLENPQLDAVKLAVGMAKELDLKIATAWKRPTTRQIIEELWSIQIQSNQYEVWVQCWCKGQRDPKRCHGDAYVAQINNGRVEAAYRKLTA